MMGLGSGRCGTKTLAYMLDKQDGCSFCHEVTPRLPYLKNRMEVREVRKRLHTIQQKDGDMVGDVAFFNLWWQQEILDFWGDRVKFICMKRSKAEVIRSFLVKCQKKLELAQGIRNFWSNEVITTVGGGQKFFNVQTVWSACFPKFLGANTFEECVSAYYDFYYDLVKEIEAPVLMVDVNELNTKAGMDKIFDFVGVEGNRKYFENLRIRDKLREASGSTMYED